MLPLTAASVDSINNESGAPKVTVWALVNIRLGAYVLTEDLRSGSVSVGRCR